MRKLWQRSGAILLLPALLSFSLSHAQPRQPGWKIPPARLRLIQTVSKTCITDEETTDCVSDPSAPEPDTGVFGSSPRCSDCIILGKPINRPTPCYPESAKAEKISGRVQVKFVVNEEGKVIWARAISGKPKLQRAAVSAACRSRFTPSTLLGSKVKVKAIGIITYVFKLS
jgi:TonB family protein